MNIQELKTKVRDLKPTWLGKFIYYCLPIRKGVVLANMRLVFGKQGRPQGAPLLADAEIKKLAQCFYSHIMKVLLENLSLGWTSSRSLKKKVKVIGAHIPIKAEREGKGLLFLTGHFGNWELTPVAALEHYPRFRHRFFVVRKTLVNKFIERILFNRFYRAGLNVIPKRNAIKHVFDQIGANNAVAFIMDQFARLGKDGIEVEFFGERAGTYKSLALVALRTGAPVIPLHCYREPDGGHVIRFLKPVDLTRAADPDREVFLNTLKFNRILEEFVLDHPEQWLWMHKRWKKKKSSR